MKHKTIFSLTCFLLCTGLTVLFAAPIAEDTYQKIQSMDVETMTMEEIISEYDSFYDRIGTMADNAREEMAAARMKQNRIAYEEAYARYVKLFEYAMSETESNRLLARILQEPEEKQYVYAQWLFRQSRYYRPTLTIDFSHDSEGYHFSYSQRLQQSPGTKINLPEELQLRGRGADMGILKGWGLTPEEATYEPGEQILMPLTNQTLYAIWTSAVKFTDSVSGIELLHDEVTEGESIPVPVPEAPDSSYHFVGWYDYTTNTLLKQNETYTVYGRGALFEAIWKRLSIDAITPLYYGFDRLPVNTQIAVGFSVANHGSLATSELTAKLATDNSHVRFLTDTLSVNIIPAGCYRTNNSRFSSKQRPNIGGESNTFRFVIDESVTTGTTIPFTLTITDAEGETWTSEVTFSVK